MGSMKIAMTAYIGGAFLSRAGNSAASVVLPIIVLTTTGSALAAGSVAAATLVPTVAIGLLAGVIIDRVNRRNATIVSDLMSAVAVALVPIVDAALGLSLGWFIALSVLGAVGDVPGETARNAMAPSVARHDGVSLDRLVGLAQGAMGLATIAGPALAGGLLALMGGPAVLWVTAGTSLAAALTGLLVPVTVGRVADNAPGTEDPARDGARPGRPALAGVWADLIEGWRIVLSMPTLRGVLVLAATSVFVMAGLQSIVLPTYLIQVGREALLGVFVSAVAAGSVVGTLGYALVGQRLARRTWFISGMVGILLGIAAIAPLASPWLALAGGLILGLASGPVNAVLGVVLLDRTPHGARGRVFSIQAAFVLGAAPAGVFVAGAVTEAWSAQAMIGLGLLLWVGLVVYSVRSTSLRDLGQPDAGQDDKADPSGDPVATLERTDGCGGIDAVS